MLCPSCGKTISDKAKFCRFCGTAITKSAPVPAQPAAQARSCRQCGAVLDSDDAEFCGQCGAATKITDTPQPEPDASPASVSSGHASKGKILCHRCGHKVSPENDTCPRCGNMKLKSGTVQAAPTQEESPSEEVRKPARKRRSPSPLIIVIIVLALAAAAYLNRDYLESWLASATGDSDDSSAMSPGDPAQEALVSDGTLESALRLAAAVYLSDSDTPGAENWEGLSVHVTYLSGDYCDFAVTAAHDDGNRLVAQLGATLKESGGQYTASDVDTSWETVLLSHGENYYDNEHESVTDTDPSAYTLIPNETKSDTYMVFKREDEEAFTINGLQIMSGVHDTQENFGTYAQPTQIELTAQHSDGASQTVTLPVVPCAFQGYPLAVVLDEPLEDVRTITLKFLETDGAQEYIAVSEISFF